ncbi:hypothetical protein [Burkholderia cepacia]|uniref:hypothetical protein n=1 Tax=Burkholderia cepacia TaxID=292 RepID=UPI0021475633|nr:hypothetical protein [Burkholderia cepacia]
MNTDAGVCRSLERNDDMLIYRLSGSPSEWSSLVQSIDQDQADPLNQSGHRKMADEASRFDYPGQPSAIYKTNRLAGEL